jgi:Spherulation-specific family 4/Concanavalin A-like lectin/glucanases superfamily
MPGMSSLVALYCWNTGGASDYWADLIATHPSGNIAIMDFSGSGPTSRNSTAAAHIADLHAGGQLLIGYVSTNHLNTALATVESTIDRWYAYYPEIDGIFLDEYWFSPPGTTAMQTYTNSVAAYIRSKPGRHLVVNNYAQQPPEWLVALCDCSYVWEDSYATWQASSHNSPSWYSKYDPSKFAVILLSVTSGTVQAAIDLAQARGIGRVYAHDLGDTNAYFRLPTIWAAEVTALGGTAPPEPPPPPSGTRTVYPLSTAGTLVSGSFQLTETGGATSDAGAGVYVQVGAGATGWVRVDSVAGTRTPISSLASAPLPTDATASGTFVLESTSLEGQRLAAGVFGGGASVAADTHLTSTLVARVLVRRADGVYAPIGRTAEDSPVVGIGATWAGYQQRTWETAAAPTSAQTDLATGDRLVVEYWAHITANTATTTALLYVRTEDGTAGWPGTGIVTPAVSDAPPPLPAATPYDQTVTGMAGLLAYWSGAEASGTVADDWGPSALDGTYVGSPTLGATGLIDTTQAPDETATAVTYTEAQHVTLGRPTFPTVAGSVVLLGRLTAAGASAGVDHALYSEGLNGGLLVGYTPDAGATFACGFVAPDGGWRLVTLNTISVLRPGNAFHLALTYDGALVRVYVGGTLAGTLAATGAITADTGTDAFLLNGYHVGQAGGAKGWGVTLQKVARYSRALTATEVAALAALAPLVSGTATHYRQAGARAVLTVGGTGTRTRNTGAQAAIDLPLGWMPPPLDADTLTCTVGGTGGQALQIQRGTYQYTDQLNQHSSLRLTLLDPDGVYQVGGLVEGTRVDVWAGADGTTHLASGVVTSSEQRLLSRLADAVGCTHDVTCSDWTARVDARLVAKDYTQQTTGAVVRDLVDTILSEEGIYSVRNRLSANQSDVETDTSGFRTSADYLIQYAGATITRDTTQAWHGAASLKVVCDGAHPNEGAETTGISLPAATRVTGSRYVCAAAGVTIRCGLRDYTNGVKAADVLVTGTGLGQWQRVAQTLTTGASPCTDLRLSTNCGGTAVASTWYVDGQQVEVGGSAQPWDVGGAGSIDEGPLLTSIRLGYVPVTQALDALAQRAVAWWTVDAARRLSFRARTAVAAPWRFTGQQASDWRAVTLTHTSPSYRNREYVPGTDETATQQETRAGDGENRTFTLRYPLAHVPTIEVSRAAGGWTAQTVGIGGVDTGAQWYWNEGRNTVSQDSDEAALLMASATTPGDRVRVTYIGQYDFLVQATDGAAVAALQARTGGDTSGLVEVYDTSEPATSLAHGFEVANAALRRFAQTGDVLTFPTHGTGLAPGQLLRVTGPFGLDADFLVESVTSDDDDAADLTSLRWTVKAVAGPADQSWQDYWHQVARRLGASDTLQLGTSATLILAESGTLALALAVTGTAQVVAYSYPSSTRYPSTTTYLGTAADPVTLTWTDTDAGKNLLRQTLRGVDCRVRYLAFGTGTPNPSPAGASDLVTEVFRTPITGCADGGSVGEELVTGILTGTDLAGTTITEVGLFAGADAGDTAGSGTLLCYAPYSHAHVATESVQITATVAIS